MRVTAVRVAVSTAAVRDAVPRADVDADVALSVFARRFASTVGVVDISVPGIIRDTAAIVGNAVIAIKNPNVNPFIFGYNYITNMHKKKENLVVSG